jgi:hypothetical protein
MRAPRFVLNFPMRYRPAGNPTWHQAATLNISRSGVLFRADAPQTGGTTAEPSLKVDLPVEIKILLQGSPEGIAEVTCSGRIVRLESADREGVELAAEFSEYEFAPMDES